MEKERLLQATNIPHMPGNDPAAPNPQQAPTPRLQINHRCITIGSNNSFSQTNSSLTLSLDCRILLIAQAPMLGTKNA